jgi:uncharacterized protein YukE
MVNFEDHQKKMTNEVERLNQLVEMLQKTMGSIRSQPTP